MNNDQLNARESDAAAWQAEWDGGLSWLAGDGDWLIGEGAVILRRWSGAALPRRPFAPAIGFALGAPATVDANDGVDWPDESVFYVDVDRVSGGGIPAPLVSGRSQVAPCNAGGWAGPVPNPPLYPRVQQGPDGKLHITWLYNPHSQQTPPAAFYIYTDSGTGTINPVAITSVAYEPERTFYSYSRTGGSDWLWIVRAETAARVASLTPLAHDGGVSQVYRLDAPGAAMSAKLISSLPAPTVYETSHTEV